MRPQENSRFLSAADYARLPKSSDRDELQGGLLVSEPRPLPRHGRVVARLTHLISDFVAAHTLGVVLTDSGFLLSSNPDTIRGPDVAFVRRDRYDSTLEAQQFFSGAPDLAVEVLSPSNSPAEIHAKVADYLAAGCPLVWIIDPERRLADVYRTLLAPRRIEATGTLDGEDVLPGFSIAVAAVVDL